MSETAVSSPKKRSRPNIFSLITQNPVILKELRGRMRGRRAFVSLTIYLVLISVLIGGIYWLLEAQGSMMRFDPSFRQNVGKTIFSSVVLFEFLMIGFIGPSLTAGAITSERERRTFDLLRTTLLSARALVLGKLGSACLFLLLIVLTALPIEALAFLLGGVGIEEMVISSAMLVVNILFFCSLGIFCSSFSKRTLTATVTSYSLILISIIALGMTYFMIVIMASRSGFSSSAQDSVLVVMLVLTSTNSFASAVTSEALFISNQIFFFGKMPGSSQIYVISPWVLHIALYMILTTIMLWLSVNFVKRPDR